MKYRADIDGLRSLAIIPVILFHAGLKKFSGGFIGVDIFFVISGFLITSLIVEEIGKETFTISNFYVRRIKRIFPALFFVMAVTGVVFSFFAVPAPFFKEIGQSIAAAVTFVSNILFWQQSDYFSTQAEFKPLLHTWSLSIEEQFYLFFPLMLILINRYLNKQFVRAVLVVFVSSLLFSSLSASAYPNANFYLLPSRAWELMLGSLIALGFAPKFSNKYILNAASIIGILMISYSIFAFDDMTPFPSYYALIPCVGTALIIISGSGGRLSAVNKILSFRPFVWTGLLSYSLYLWHYPLFSLRKYWSFRYADSFFFSNTFLIFLTVILALMSYFFIETPFRKMKINNRKLFFSSTLVIMIFLTGAGLLVHLQEGMAWRFPNLPVLTEDDKDLGGFGISVKDVRYDSAYFVGDTSREPETILWGDSHARSYSYGVDAFGKKYGKSIFVVGFVGTPPVLDIEVVDRHKPKRAIQFNDKVFQIIAENSNIQNVLLSARWLAYYSPEDALDSTDDRRLATLKTVSKSADMNKTIMKTHMEKMIKQLNSLGKNVFVLMDVPNYSNTGTGVYQGYVKRTTSKRDYNRYARPFRRMLQQLQVKTPFTIVEYQDGLFEDNQYITVKNGQMLYRDQQHLTKYGSIYIAEKNEELLKTLIK